MTTLEKCLRTLRAIDHDYCIDLKLTADGVFQIGAVYLNHDPIYEAEESDSLDQAIENLWVVLKEQVKTRNLRLIIKMIDEDEQ